jgi:hypothetical protein
MPNDERTGMEGSGSKGEGEEEEEHGGWRLLSIDYIRDY